MVFNKYETLCYFNVEETTSQAFYCLNFFIIMHTFKTINKNKNPLIHNPFIKDRFLDNDNKLLQRCLKARLLTNYIHVHV